MATEQNNTFINTFTGGMNTDSAYDTIKNNQYIYAVNLRPYGTSKINSSNDIAAYGKYGVMTPVKALNEDITYTTQIVPKFDDDKTQRIIKIITSGDTNILIKLHNNYIYLYKVDASNELPRYRWTFLCKIKIREKVEDAVDLRNVSAVLQYETDKVVNLYIADGEHKIMIINVKDTDYIKSLYKIDETTHKTEGEIDIDLQDYHSRLFPNSNQKKQREIIEENQNIIDNDYDPNEAYDREIALIHGVLISPKNQQMFKNELFDVIIQGEDNSEAINKINNILKLTNHDKNPKKGDPEYIFNKPFKNGKNLFYLACQEGKLEIVKCFLSKGFNPKLKSKVDDIGSESPLECACRWNYLKIIELLLSKVKYSEREIQNALMIDGLNKKIIVLLKKYLKEHCKKDKIYCFC